MTHRVPTTSLAGSSFSRKLIPLPKKVDANGINQNREAADDSQRYRHRCVRDPQETVAEKVDAVKNGIE